MSKKTILVVDDTPVNVEILTGILGGTYNIKYATNGICALKSAQRNPPQLILLDIMMPEMDGYEACRRFKENPDTSEIPIIFITAKTERKDIVKALKLGAKTMSLNPSILKNYAHASRLTLIYKIKIRNYTKQSPHKTN